MLQWRPVPADRMGTTPVLRGVPMKPAPGRVGRRHPGLVCAPAFAILWPGAGTTGELAWGDVATPLRIVNLNPFQLLYGVPGSLGAHVMTPGSSELIASMDMASHLIEASPGAERVLIDGETYKQGLALRHGFGDGWEYLFTESPEVSALSHRARYRPACRDPLEAGTPGCVQPTGPEPCNGMLMTLECIHCQRCR